MMRLYLAGPMRGIKDENREAFREAREKLRDMGHEVFCPSEFSGKWMLDINQLIMIDLQWIANNAEGVVCLPGWSKSKGALAEVHLAWALGKPLPVYEYALFSRRVIREVKNDFVRKSSEVG